MIPLDAGEPRVVKERVRAYLEVLGLAEDVCQEWMLAATADGQQASAAFTALQRLMMERSAGSVVRGGDELGTIALWRCMAWLGESDRNVALLIELPPIVRQSMASERDRS